MTREWGCAPTPPLVTVGLLDRLRRVVRRVGSGSRTSLVITVWVAETTYSVAQGTQTAIIE